ncbi:MAG: V-type ATP synthase subunit E family protein [Candidatus Aminicenantaceae bacterium]|jgi:V/A-type H+-transporting ATPase subunit E
MSLENILDKILEEARSEAEQILLKGRQKAEEITQNARKQGEMQANAILEQAERKGNLEANRLVTQARLEKRIKILSCKRDLIDEVLDKAFQKQKGDKIGLKRKIIRKDGELEEFVDQEKLKQELRPKLEKDIAEVLKI